jgi:hypothetical protein
MNEVDFKYTYNQIEPLVKKDSQHDLYIGIGSFFILCGFAWYYENINIAYVGVPLLVLFIVKSIYVKRNLPNIFEATIKAKRKVEYLRTRQSSNSNYLSYDYYIDFTVHSGGKFNEMGIKEPLSVKEISYQVWDNEKFEMFAENDKVYVFSSASKSLLAILKDGEYISFEVI